MSDPRRLRAYLLVTLCYWVFTLSDGALRMIVLLHLHDQGETAWGLALILLPYEAAGVATNLLGGFLGARYGLKRTLLLGLLLDGSATVVAAGAELYGLALFADGVRPEWEALPGGGAVRAPLRSVDEALEHALLAVGGATAVPPVGVRLLRGRSDGGCRAELWVADAAQAPALAEDVRGHLQQTGHGGARVEAAPA